MIFPVNSIWRPEVELPLREQHTSGQPRSVFRIAELCCVAEREGFEPPVPCGTTVFKTAALGHSATSPINSTVPVFWSRLSPEHGENAKQGNPTGCGRSVNQDRVRSPIQRSGRRSYASAKGQRELSKRIAIPSTWVT